MSFTRVIGLSLALASPGCGSPTEAKVDHGDCTQIASEIGELGGIRFSIEVDAETVTYEAFNPFSVHYENLTEDRIDLQPTGSCLVRTWFRGEEAFTAPECLIFQFFLAAGGQSTTTFSSSFRPVGTKGGIYRHDSTSIRNRGAMAPPGRYCFVAEIAISGDTILLESVFDLVDS